MSENPSLFFSGRYLKYSRDLPQTHWDCPRCLGARVTAIGELCTLCGGTDRLIRPSIEDFIGIPLKNATGSSRAILHAAGREDLDTRCLGNGRPFVVELLNPKQPIQNIDQIWHDINQNADSKLIISPLVQCDDALLRQIKLQSEYTAKEYHALVYSPVTFEKQDFQSIARNLTTNFVNKSIQQETPRRILKRKRDRIRTRQIYSIQCEFIDPAHILLRIVTQGGTYIKEFISGDGGRTRPSLSEAIGVPLSCVALDVVAFIEQKDIEKKNT